VGPVDDPAALERAAIIVRADRPAAKPAGEVIGAPRASTPRGHAEPDEHDHKLRDLVVYMAKGLVDHPDDVSVEVLEAGDGGELELRVHQDDIRAHFADFVRWLSTKDIDLGLITNGFPPKIPEEIYSHFKWIRISITPPDASPFYPDGRFE